MFSKLPARWRHQKPPPHPRGRSQLWLTVLPFYETLCNSGFINIYTISVVKDLKFLNNNNTILGYNTVDSRHGLIPSCSTTGWQMVMFLCLQHTCLCLLTLLSSEQSSQYETFRPQHVQLVTKTPSFKTKLIDNNAEAIRVNRNTHWRLTFPRFKHKTSPYELPLCQSILATGASTLF